jgi:hypothetical protein
MHSASASDSATAAAVTSLVSMMLLLRQFKFLAVHITVTCSEHAIQEIMPGACTSSLVGRCAAQ